MPERSRDLPPADQSIGEEPQLPNRRQLVQGVAGFLALAGVSGCSSRDGAEEVSSGAPEVADAVLPEELWQGGAGQLARAIERAEVSSLEVVDAHLARIEVVNEKTATAGPDQY